MGGRSFDASNKQLPAGIEAMAETPPACFDQPMWRLWLVECQRGALNLPGERKRMLRGQLPDYCSDCPRVHREAMRAVGRCHPPVLGPLLADLSEDAERELAAEQAA